MVTFDNLLHNFAILRHSYSTSSSTSEICLLPHYHTFALVGSYLHTLYEGGSAYFLSPKSFTDRPSLWVEAMSKYGITHAKVPGSAFSDSLFLQLHHNDDRGKTNLKRVQCIACLQPVSYEAVNRFEECMSRFRLKEDIVSVGYGLPEHVSLVSGICSHRRQGRTVSMSRIDCGEPALGVSVKIVDQSDFSEEPEGHIGEVWVCSKSKAAGYYKDEQSTLEVFGATLSGRYENRIFYDEEDTTIITTNGCNDHYLRTGDLGFVKNGKLFVCGKLADVLTIQDKCVNPLDIEMAAESAVSKICSGKSMAFRLKPHRQTKEISLLVELKSSNYTEQECQHFQVKIEGRISRDFNLPVHAVIFFKPLMLPLSLFGRKERELSHRLACATDLQVYNKWVSTKPYKWMSEKEKAKVKTKQQPKITPKPQSKLLESKKLLLTPPPGPKSSPTDTEAPILSPVPMQRLSQWDRRSPRPSPKCSFTVRPETSPPTSPLSGVSSAVMSPSQLKSPSSEGKMSAISESLSLYSDAPQSPLSADKLAQELKLSPSPRGRSRRLSAPLSPRVAATSPTGGRKRTKRAKSIADEFLAKSSMDGFLHALKKRTGHTVRPGEKIWEEDSSHVEEISVMLQEEYGFNMSKETLVLTKSPEDLLKAMKMSLLSMEVVTQEPFSLSFSSLPPPIYEPFLTRVYWSQCRLYLKNVEQYQHRKQDVAIVGMGGLFTGQCTEHLRFWVFKNSFGFNYFLEEATVLGSWLVRKHSMYWSDGSVQTQ